MTRVQDGDTEAFRIIVEHYRDPLLRLLLPIVGDAKEAEDVLQETFVRIFLSLREYRGEGFVTWISRIAVRQAIDWRRKKGRRRETPEADVELRAEMVGAAAGIGLAAAAESPDERLLERERVDRFADRLGRLPSRYRDVVQAYYVEEKSYQEIADREGIAAKTVESRLYRARRWMRDHWKEEPE
ncbi:RNA polymerase sigma factor [Cohnella faecalis]|uniref:RNA polymerase sigma factor n=1 Tax=Cohnella faecalis TaxID=2315694 RepID=UPI002278535E|nr:sigma-70 family RNA polymerase sigma factor [Cohnella faecalis]